MSSKNGASFLYDPKVRSLFFQAVFGIVLFALIWIGVRNLVESYGGFSMEFLSRPSPIQVLTTFGTWITGYEAGVSSNWVAFMVGIANTLIVAVLGIFLATIIGFTLGIFRLSKNFVLRSFSTVYIEALRNIPLLLQILFWQVIFRLFSDGLKKADAVTIIDGAVYYNADGLRAPYLDWQENGIWVFIALVAGIVIAWAVSRWASARQAATGQQFPSFWVGLGIIIGLPLIVFLIMGRPVVVELPTEITEGPKLKQGAWEQGVGMFVTAEMIALLLALSTYTAAFIAEIVRAGILAVPKGQTEASQALGLSNSVALRKVIIPQAMRVVIPPLTSQYLNLTKNSSLAAAIGYPEIVALFAGTTLNQTGRAVEIILLVIGVYLTISLITSLFMNWFNNRMKLVER